MGPKLDAPEPERRAGPCRRLGGGRWGRLLGFDDRDGAASAAGAEVDHARAGRKDRVVTAEADAVARAEPRAALPHDDLAAVHRLAGEDLDPEVLRVGVAAVPARSESLLMSHLWPPPSWLKMRRRILWPPAFWKASSRR